MSLSDELLADFEDEGMNVDGTESKLSTIKEEETEMDTDLINPTVPGIKMDYTRSVKSVAKLYNSKKLNCVMSNIAEFSEKKRGPVSGPVEMDPEYQVIVEANQITVEITDEIGIIHKFTKDIYLPRYPELDSLVQQPLEFIRTVNILKNDILENSKLSDELQDFLPSATIMVLSVTASTTTGKKLSEEDMELVKEACRMAVELEEMKQRILAYVQSRMSFIAPNLTVIVGASTAAKLMGTAGGLTNLAKMPACNAQVVGAVKKTLSGFSQANILPHTGYIFYTDIVQSAPPEMRRKVVRMVAAKAVLAARVDASHESPDGTIGSRFLADIEGKLEKMTEPPPVKAVKALPAPIETSKKKRGGRRARKMKERLGITEMRKTANRMNFGDIEDEAYQSDLGFSMGNLGKKSTGKLRAASVDSKTKARVSKTLQQKLNKQQVWGGSTTVRKQISGTASVAFTPMQGLEIVNPGAAEQKVREANEKYFSNTAGFMSVMKGP